MLSNIRVSAGITRGLRQKSTQRPSIGMSRLPLPYVSQRARHLSGSSPPGSAITGAPGRSSRSGGFESGSKEAVNGATSGGLVGSQKRLPEFNLVDRVVLVSGGARGLGLTQAEALLEAGAKGSPSPSPVLHGEYWVLLRLVLEPSLRSRPPRASITGVLQSPGQSGECPGNITPLPPDRRA